MTETVETPPTGAMLADLGMKQAAAHADAVVEHWGARAFAVLAAYAAENPVFTSEDVRHYAEQSGLPEPPDARAWGAVMRTGVRNRVIGQGGFVSSKNSQAHHRPIRQWISRKFSQTALAS